MLSLHLGPESLAQELQTSQMNLKQLAEETGGVAAVGTNDLNKALDRIVLENSSYYVLGYYSTNEKRDGKLRNISVKVAGHADSQVTYRKRYAAQSGRAPRNTAAGKPIDPAAGVTAELTQSLATPLPLAGMQLRLTAIPQKGTGKNATLRVLVEAVGKDLTFKQNNGLYTNKLSFQIGVFNKEGKSVAVERPDTDLNLKQDTYTRVTQHGVRMLRQPCCATDDIRFGAARRTTGRPQGSAILDIDVPDFSKGPLVLSGVAIASSADGRRHR